MQHSRHSLHAEAHTPFIVYVFLSSFAEFKSDKSHGRNLFFSFFSSRASTSASLLPPSKLPLCPVLFRGVHPGDVIFWAPVAAHAAAEDGTTFWSNVIGVDAPCMSDLILFRVLE
jgi:hypothetical protein